MRGTKTHLTTREIEVLRHLATGASSAEVAARLFITKRTVDFHCANIYTSLGVSNRIQAMNEARRLGLVDW